MKLVIRALAVLVVAPATYYFIYWVPFSLIPLDDGRWVASIVSLFCAVGAGWHVWSKTGFAPDTLISSIFYSAIVLGGIGFTAGFFGPMIFAPEANQGPLVGIFITGPLGFLLGGVGGLVYWLIHRKKSDPGY